MLRSFLRDEQGQEDGETRGETAGAGDHGGSSEIMRPHRCGGASEVSGRNDWKVTFALWRSGKNP